MGEDGSRIDADRTFVEARLADALAELDLEARGRHRRLMGGCLTLLLGGGLWIALLARWPDEDWVGLPLAAASVWFSWSAFAANRGFAREFRARVLGPLVAHVHEGLRYDPEGAVPREALEASGLFLRPIGYVLGRDHVSGTVDGVAVRCAFIQARGVRPPSGSGRQSSEPPVVFSGLFVVADFPRRATGATYVLPDRAERWFGDAGRLVQELDRRRGSIVRLEDPEFETMFKVYADDQVDARWVLSTSLMERLVRFRRKRESAPMLSIRGSSIHLAFASETNPLEPPSWAEVAYTQKTESGRARLNERVLGYLDDLRLSVEVVRDLRLDVRIWSVD